jgi:hypothetical protein
MVPKGDVDAKVSDSQTLAALGAASVDHGAATTGFHANQKAMGTGASGLGGLVGALHGRSLLLLNRYLSGKPIIISKIPRLHPVAGESHLK